MKKYLGTRPAPVNIASPQPALVPNFVSIGPLHQCLVFVGAHTATSFQFSIPIKVFVDHIIEELLVQIGNFGVFDIGDRRFQCDVSGTYYNGSTALDRLVPGMHKGTDIDVLIHARWLELHHHHPPTLVCDTSLKGTLYERLSGVIQHFRFPLTNRFLLDQMNGAFLRVFPNNHPINEPFIDKSISCKAVCNEETNTSFLKLELSPEGRGIPRDYPFYGRGLFFYGYPIDISITDGSVGATTLSSAMLDVRSSAIAVNCPIRDFQVHVSRRLMIFSPDITSFRNIQYRALLHASRGLQFSSVGMIHTLALSWVRDILDFFKADSMGSIEDMSRYSLFFKKSMRSQVKDHCPHRSKDMHQDPAKDYSQFIYWLTSNSMVFKAFLGDRAHLFKADLNTVLLELQKVPPDHFEALPRPEDCPMHIGQPPMVQLRQHLMATVVSGFLAHCDGTDRLSEPRVAYAQRLCEFIMLVSIQESPIFVMLHYLEQLGRVLSSTPTMPGVAPYGYTTCALSRDAMQSFRMIYLSRSGPLSEQDPRKLFEQLVQPYHPMCSLTDMVAQACRYCLQLSLDSDAPLRDCDYVFLANAIQAILPKNHLEGFVHRVWNEEEFTLSDQIDPSLKAKYHYVVSRLAAHMGLGETYHSASSIQELSTCSTPNFPQALRELAAYMGDQAFEHSKLMLEQVCAQLNSTPDLTDDSLSSLVEGIRLFLDPEMSFPDLFASLLGPGESSCVTQLNVLKVMAALHPTNADMKSFISSKLFTLEDLAQLPEAQHADYVGLVVSLGDSMSSQSDTVSDACLAILRCDGFLLSDQDRLALWSFCKITRHDLDMYCDDLCRYAASCSDALDLFDVVMLFSEDLEYTQLTTTQYLRLLVLLSEHFHFQDTIVSPLVDKLVGLMVAKLSDEQHPNLDPLFKSAVLETVARELGLTNDSMVYHYLMEVASQHTCNSLPQHHFQRAMVAMSLCGNLVNTGCIVVADEGWEWPNPETPTPPWFVEVYASFVLLACTSNASLPLGILSPAKLLGLDYHDLISNDLKRQLLMKLSKGFMYGEDSLPYEQVLKLVPLIAQRPHDESLLEHLIACCDAKQLQEKSLLAQWIKLLFSLCESDSTTYTRVLEPFVVSCVVSQLGKKHSINGISFNGTVLQQCFDKSGTCRQSVVTMFQDDRCTTLSPTSFCQGFVLASSTRTSGVEQKESLSADRQLELLAAIKNDSLTYDEWVSVLSVVPFPDLSNAQREAFIALLTPLLELHPTLYKFYFLAMSSSSEAPIFSKKSSPLKFLDALKALNNVDVSEFSQKEWEKILRLFDFQNNHKKEDIEPAFALFDCIIQYYPNYSGTLIASVVSPGYSLFFESSPEHCKLASEAVTSSDLRTFILGCQSKGCLKLTLDKSGWPSKRLEVVGAFGEVFIHHLRTVTPEKFDHAIRALDSYSDVLLGPGWWHLPGIVSALLPLCEGKADRICTLFEKITLLWPQLPLGSEPPQSARYASKNVRAMYAEQTTQSSKALVQTITSVLMDTDQSSAMLLTLLTRYFLQALVVNYSLFNVLINQLAPIMDSVSDTSVSQELRQFYERGVGTIRAARSMGITV